MGQAVEHGTAKALRSEDLSPRVEGSVRGNAERAARVALGNGFEAHVGARLRARHEALFVEGQHLLAGELLLKALQAALVCGLDAFMDKARPRWWRRSSDPSDRPQARAPE